MRFTFLFILAFLLLPSLALSQSKTLDDLNREKSKLLSLIEQSNKMMEEYANRRDNEMMRISVVDDKIAKRRALIEVYNNEIKAYNEQISLINKQIDSVGVELQRQKDEYAELLRKIQAARQWLLSAGIHSLSQVVQPELSAFPLSTPICRLSQADVSSAYRDERADGNSQSLCISKTYCHKHLPYEDK